MIEITQQQALNMQGLSSKKMQYIDSIPQKLFMTQLTSHLMVTRWGIQPKFDSFLIYETWGLGRIGHITTDETWTGGPKITWIDMGWIEIGLITWDGRDIAEYMRSLTLQFS